MLAPFLIDIEKELLPVSLLEILLTDRTTGNNIFWATSDYEHLGEGFSFGDTITLKQVTGENRDVVIPRVLKSKRRRKPVLKIWRKYSRLHGFVTNNAMHLMNHLQA